MTPSGWCATTVRQVAEVAIGKTPARNEKSYWDREKTTQNRWATIADIKRKFIGETSEHISDLGVQRSNARLVPPGTLLMSFKLTLGRAAITSRSMYTNEAIAAFYPNGLADTEYLYYLFPTLALEKSSDRAVKGRTLNKAKLRALRLALPPLTEQRKIAAILSSVDDAIEKTQAVIAQVQVVKRGLMKELLTRGLPGRHTRFKQTEIGEIPEEWRVVAIGALGHDSRTAVRTGPFGSSMKTKDFRSSGVPVITIQSIGEGELYEPGLFFTSEGKADELSEYSVAEGDLVFSRVADIGRSLAVDARLSGWLISPNLIRIRPDRRKADARFMMYAITLAKGVVRQIISISGNAGRPVVSSSILRRLCIPVPKLGEQREISRAGQRLESRIRTEMAKVNLLKELKGALMSVLLTGELRVVPDPEVA